MVNSPPHYAPPYKEISTVKMSQASASSLAWRRKNYLILSMRDGAPTVVVSVLFSPRKTSSEHNTTTPMVPRVPQTNRV